MKIPTLHGYIDRRILINYTADPKVIQNLLPYPFRPKLQNGKAIVGICLIRLKNIRPKGLPQFIGVNSENAAHRFAIEWDENGETKEGVYIPRRDTSSTVNAIAGGRVFPGKHNKAKFNVSEAGKHCALSFSSSDAAFMNLEASETNQFNSESVFEDIETASAFLKGGRIGYTPGNSGLDSVILDTYTWQVKPLHVTKVESSYFNDKNLFPEGSIKFDNALVMHNIEHEWKINNNKSF
ncbi:DUF2071 domain-containing protein [Flavobacterium beibuense]|uniref:DUF2071 domain containing protein n=1 Tax=Flavobacterium beibuense TaxID=657326 RepID=A0A444WF53_9FLAO|nr:DUF2071 domain-containing protein [Flavobacterium beibuense]RYJ44435.1 DUF2071 domain containing protein [Flavobacterium beibuense]